MGIRTEVKHAEVFPTDEEDVLWKTGTLETGSPSSLVNAVFYNNGKILGLRGGEEDQYAQPHLKEQCYVYLLCCYFSKLPKAA